MVRAATRTHGTGKLSLPVPLGICWESFTDQPGTNGGARLHSRKELQTRRFFPLLRCNFPRYVDTKKSLLEKAFRGFSRERDYVAFERKNHLWLDRFALFLALREANGDVAWNRFDPRVKPHPQRIRFHKFVQYEFFRQWRSLRDYCHKRNISILGDMPFYVEHDSADVWSYPHLFDLYRDGEPDP